MRTVSIWLRNTALVALLLPAAVAATTPGDASFDSQLALARQNLATEAGAAYDRALAEAMRPHPAVSEAINACLRNHPGDQDVQGYFHFTSASKYTVVLSPTGPFATCIAKALQGQPLPAPPRLPWFNHFTLRTEAAATGATP